MKNIIVAVFVAILSFSSLAAQKGHAEVKLDGKPIDLKKLTQEEVITLATLVMKAGGK